MNLTHNDKVEDEDDIFCVRRVLTQFRGIQPRVDDHLGKGRVQTKKCKIENDHHGGVCAVAVQLVVDVLEVDGLDLEELGRVVQDGEGDDGEDVAQAVAHVALLEGEADREKALDGDGDDSVDAAGEGDVDDRQDVGGDVGKQPGEVGVREAVGDNKRLVSRGKHTDRVKSKGQALNPNQIYREGKQFCGISQTYKKELPPKKSNLIATICCFHLSTLICNPSFLFSPQFPNNCLVRRTDCATWAGNTAGECR